MTAGRSIARAPSGQGSRQLARISIGSYPARKIQSDAATSGRRRLSTRGLSPAAPRARGSSSRQDALGLVGRDQGYAEAVAERGDGPFGLLCQDIETGDHERALRFREPRAGRIQHRARGRRHRRGGRARDRRRCGLLPGGLHIDRDVEEHRARPASGRNGDRLVGEDGGPSRPRREMPPWRSVPPA